MQKNEGAFADRKFESCVNAPVTFSQALIASWYPGRHPDVNGTLDLCDKSKVKFGFV
jgi:hypothetical protein